MIRILGNPPFFTFFSFVLCCLLLIFGPEVHQVCMIPRFVLPGLQLYRVFLAPFFHIGLFHLLFNMIAWLSIVRDFEHTAGSLSTMYAFLILLTPLNSILHTTLAYTLDAIFHSTYEVRCSVGVSGLLFSTLVVNLHTSGNTHTSFLGLFSLPTLWYPPFLALLLQIFAPDISLLGHLSGIISGHILARGWLRKITPPVDAFDSCERRLRLTRLPVWQPAPSPFGHLLASGSPSYGAPSITQRIQNSWRSMMSRGSQRPAGTAAQTSGYSSNAPVGTAFNPPSPSASTQPFSGEGFTLGGTAPADEEPAGRVPPTSRLLQLDRTLATDGHSDSGVDVEERQHEVSSASSGKGTGAT